MQEHAGPVCTASHIHDIRMQWQLINHFPNRRRTVSRNADRTTALARDCALARQNQAQVLYAARGRDHYPADRLLGGPPETAERVALT